MNSLKDAFSETGTASEPDRKSLSTENLESLLAESTKKRSSRETDSSRAFAEAVNDSLKREMAASRPVKTETEKNDEPLSEALGQTAEKMGIASALKREIPVEIPDSILNEEEPKKPMRFHRSDDEEGTESRRDPGAVVLAVLLTLFLTAAGIGGSLFYTLYTYLPMANAVNNSSCAEVFEGDYIAGLNTLAEEENLNIAFTREVLVGGQVGKRGNAGSLARFSFAGAALLIELLSVLVMVTGVFRRYNAAYAYITVLSDKYMMGAIVACMAAGAFFMVLAACAAVLASKE